MALLWEYEQNGEYYAVTQAGNSIRLYRNGVHHSQWNPKRPLSGSVWDLLALPIGYRPQAQAGRVLALGMGAGAVVRIIEECFPHHSITGVDLDPIHLTIAQGFFDLGENVTCIQADAKAWVAENAKNEQQQYDYIIDDLYGEEANGLPARAIALDASWFERLLALLAPGGTLILNCLEPDKVRDLPLFTEERLRSRFQSAKSLSIEGYDNRVLAFSEIHQTNADLQAVVRRIQHLYPRCAGVWQRYQIKPLRLS